MSMLRHVGRVLITLALVSPAAGADVDYQEVFKEAADAYHEDYRDAWAFVEERERDNVVWLGKWDPRASQQWALLAVDGREPSSDDHDQYQDDKADEAKRAKERPGSPFAAIKEGTLELIEETQQAWHFSFQPTGEGSNEAFMSYLEGTMTILKSGPAIDTINIKSNGEFKPRFGFKVREFRSRYEFRRAAPDGPMVPSKIDFRIAAKAMGMVNVDEQVSVDFRDYERVPGQSPGSATTE
jgi:hypothetical protein